MKKRKAKLFRKGSSQAVRPPAEFRFAGDDVRTGRDRETGEVVLLPITASWDEFFAQRERTPERRGFLALVSNNERDFGHVPRLTLQNWTRAR